MKPRKAIIAAAGKGTRFLPVTKTQPKEMLPILNKPVIQYAIEELIESGIKQIIIITAKGKHSMEEYFCRSSELESILLKKGQNNMRDDISTMCSLGDIYYVYQHEQLGLGHAVMTARNFIDNEPFVLLLPDDVIRSQIPATQQLIQIFEQYKTNIVAVEKVPRESISSYGIILPRKIGERIYQVLGLVEKPQAKSAPSSLGIVGRYILTADILDVLRETPVGKGDEIQLTDALNIILGQQNIIGYEFEGTRYDTGTPLGLLKASIALAFEKPDTVKELQCYLANLKVTAVPGECTPVINNL